MMILLRQQQGTFQSLQLLQELLDFVALQYSFESCPVPDAQTSSSKSWLQIIGQICESMNLIIAGFKHCC